jgi:hypothetical protein|tara:strand:- start:109 stop:372 length:264 start_codon:yes stop_codon:yes gene_type:complete
LVVDDLGPVALLITGSILLAEVDDRQRKRVIATVVLGAFSSLQIDMLVEPADQKSVNGVEVEIVNHQVMLASCQVYFMAVIANSVLR